MTPTKLDQLKSYMREKLTSRSSKDNLAHLAVQMRETTIAPSERRQGNRLWGIASDDSSSEIASITDWAGSITSGGSSKLGSKASTTTTLVTPYLESEPHSLSKTMLQDPWIGGPDDLNASQTRSIHKEKESVRSSEQKSPSHQDSRTRETDTERTTEADADYVTSWIEGHPDEADGGISGQPQLSRPTRRDLNPNQSIGVAGPKPAEPPQGSADPPHCVFFSLSLH